MSLSSGSDSDDGGDHLQPHTTTNTPKKELLKIKVLYYKNGHSRTAIGTKGKLLLNEDTISFFGRGYEYQWDLTSITVEQFRGRLYGGIFIQGQRKWGLGMDRISNRGDNNAQDPIVEYTFTKVSKHAYDIIQNSIDEAKFNSEMTAVRRTSMQQIAKSGISLSSSLSAVDDNDMKLQRESTPKLLLPFQYLIMILITIFCFFYKLITGRRYWAPTSMPQAMHGVLRSIYPILSVSKKTIDGIKMKAIEKDINQIQTRLQEIQRVYREQSDAYQSSGSIADGGVSSSFHERRVLVSWAIVWEKIRYVFFFFRRKLNLPTLRWIGKNVQYQWGIRHPTTISKAIKNANENVVELIYYIEHREKLASEVRAKIKTEVKEIQILLFNIKSIGLAASPSSKED